MSLATPTTHAPAARKRGGGLARRYLLASLLMGRHPRQTGGETKSLCRAAAGITSALPSACGSLVYPTKGVRQAQKSSLSLRSLSSPAAQLVKGGKHLVCVSRTDEIVSKGRDLSTVDPNRKIGISARTIMCGIAEVPAEGPETTQRTQVQIHEIYIVQAGTVKGASRLVVELERFKRGEPVAALDDNGSHFGEFMRGAANTLHQLSSNSQSDGSSLAPLQLSPLKRAQLYINCQENSQDRTHSLYPRRQVGIICLVTSHRGTNKTKARCQPNRSSLPVDAQHHTLPTSNLKQRSLPTHFPHVQGGSA